ncbi:Putative uncharacterized protein [Taphrina deformans PYCC 5710]|uniref:Uncharacterized protein n=1 Tax=Taphrina deformans (strain PYCC 5710 / ATCC 11124 / CBS 356.35 / IMI 108563 / JCM 9778 / NBRC 8474) TaxID=1097556 RepID=R4XE95_TAPDE|nr:Putative uncharacterized protein [Taphrina deformans PYCC 5710]|eukprot:CCG81682.1 Putative uncharacterized protein [Taphrina deformans PYCC 5710]
MPSKMHLTPELKAAMRRQTVLPHGFPRDESSLTTASAIEHAISILRRHRPRSWHLILVGAYTGFNFGRGVQAVWAHIDGSGEVDGEGKVRMGAEMREAIVKCVPFLGIPRVLASLGALQAAQGPDVARRVGALLGPLRDDVRTDAGLMMDRGRGLWDDIYSPPDLSHKLRRKIATLHPNLDDLIVRSSYGHALSPTGLVGREDTSALAVTVLRVEEDVLDQLTSHVFGLLKGGGDQAYVQAIIDVVDGLRAGVLGDRPAKL